MGVACWIGVRYTYFAMHSRFLIQLLIFVGMITGATALYLGLAWVFRCHELEEIYGIATRRKGSAAFAEG
jgi:hypothetical protein